VESKNEIQSMLGGLRYNLRTKFLGYRRVLQAYLQATPTLLQGALTAFQHQFLDNEFNKIQSQTIPRFFVPLHVYWKEGVQLHSFSSLQGYQQPGDRVQLELVWISSGPLQRSYVVFVHLRDASGKSLVWGDSIPSTKGTQIPTDSWKKDQTVIDTHWLQLPESLPSGTYTIALGFFSPKSPYPRLLLHDGKDELTLGYLDIGHDTGKQRSKERELFMKNWT
jgi:hypothetical protein